MNDPEKTRSNNARALPFSSDLLEAYQEYKQADQHEREQISLAFASMYTEEHNTTDNRYSDEYHRVFEDFQKAQLEFEHAAMRVCRIADTVITEVLEESGLGLDMITPPSNPTAN